MSPEKLQEESEMEMWERELREAGWKPYQFRGKPRLHIWEAPNGALYHGPYAAWRMMQSVKQWGGKP